MGNGDLLNSSVYEALWDMDPVIDQVFVHSLLTVL